MTDLQLVCLTSFLVNLTLDLNRQNYMMIWLPILSLDQIIMNCNVPRLGQLVGVGVTVTVTVVVIVMNSGEAVSTYKGNKQYLSTEALATYSNKRNVYKSGFS